MAYNYFCCRKHTPPVKYAAAQPNNMPGTFASPMCPSCGKTMEFYDSGAAPTDPRPVPPPLPAVEKVPKLSSAEVPLYSGSGDNPGHGLVTWTITRNAAKAEVTFTLNLGVKTAGQYDATHVFKLADGLLQIGAQNDQENWWINAPMTGAGADKAIWHSLDLASMATRAIPGVVLPAKIEIGVKLGNSRFGLIHLLAGHAKSVRNVGAYSIDTEGIKGVDAYVPMIALQSGMRRFAQEQITRINYDNARNKFLLQGQYSGLIVVTRTPGSPRYAITTLYNTTDTAFGQRVFPA